jgi:uridine phosphorylase
VRSIDNRYLSPAIVMKNRFANNPKPDWKIAILCFRDFIGCEILINTFKAKPVQGYKVFYGIDSNETERQVFESDLLGLKIGIITRLSWGGPQAAILVEELTQMGVQYIIGYGAAGSIDGDISKGDLVIGTRSLNTDGTSKTYLPDKHVLFCNKELLQITREEAIHLEINIKEVIVANVDALYRETKDLIFHYQSEGAQIVNLETSALFASSEICNASSLWLGFISDSLVSDIWDDWDIDTKELSLVISKLCMKTVERIAIKLLESSAS